MIATLRLHLCLIVVCLPMNALAQSQDGVQSKLLKSADQFAKLILKQRANLPDRWAALQERETIEISRHAKLETDETQIITFSAYSREKKTILQRVTERGHVVRVGVREDSIPFQSWAFQKPGLTLFKVDREDWKVVPKIPNIGHPATDPYSWCLANHISSRNGLLNEGYLESLLGTSRVCVQAHESTSGLISVWGSPAPSNELATSITILFDETNHLPIELDWQVFPAGWDPDDFASKPHRSLEKVKVVWKEHGSKKESLYLPSEIKINHTGIGDEGANIKVTNKIRWLLDDDVPDKLFENPQTSPLVELEFPAIAPKLD